MDNNLEDSEDGHTKHFATKINDRSVNIDNDNNENRLSGIQEIGHNESKIKKIVFM
jgi:hypothetical protein